MTEKKSTHPPVYTPETYTAQSSVGRLLADVVTLLDRNLDQRAQEIGVSGAQWRVLMRLGTGMDRTAAELCRAIGYDSGSMTRMLDRLVKRGLVERVRCDEDRRVVLLRLTPAGEDMYPRLRPIGMEMLNRSLEGFSQEEVETLKGFLHRIQDNAKHLE